MRELIVGDNCKTVVDSGKYDSEKRNTASEDRSNYRIVKKGDVPYNVNERCRQGAVGIL